MVHFLLITNLFVHLLMSIVMLPVGAIIMDLVARLVGQPH